MEPLRFRYRDVRSFKECTKVRTVNSVLKKSASVLGMKLNTKISKELKSTLKKIGTADFGLLLLIQFFREFDPGSG